jgi:hypothetical protein
MLRFAAVIGISLVTASALGTATLPVASYAHGGPAVYVEPPTTWTFAPVTFVVKHAPPFTRYQMEASPWPGNESMGNGDIIKMGIHRTNSYGKFRMHFEFRNRLVHFHGKVFEKWVVSAIQFSSAKRRSITYQREFRMFHGCGCGGAPFA